MALSRPLHLLALSSVVLCTIYACILARKTAKEDEQNDCLMTYMYPNYVPIAIDAPPGRILNETLAFDEDDKDERGKTGVKGRSFARKYGLYFYREGWKHANIKESLRRLSGVPVLFIPGNGGSYRQARSLAAESDRLFSSGPQDASTYKLATLTPEEGAYLSVLDSRSGSLLSSQQSNWSALAEWRAAMGQNKTAEFPNRLDWFMVDFHEEFSALDAKISMQHTEFVVTAIHKILELYQEVVAERRAQQQLSNIKSLNRLKRFTDDAPEPEQPSSVLLVGHSMGGAIARAAVVHPQLKPKSVNTVITLSSPHVAPPIASQPALVQWLSGVNKSWRQLLQPNRDGTAPDLANLLVASIAGGTKDNQVRSALSHLDDLGPSGFFVTAGTTSMPSVWLSTDHLCIMWCNQLVVQVATAILNLVDPKSRQLHADPVHRHAILASHFRSAIPQSFGWLPTASSVLSDRRQNSLLLGSDTEINRSSRSSAFNGSEEVFAATGECPPIPSWIIEPQQTDIFAETSMVTVTARDGRRRWMNIQAWASKGKDHLVVVTSLVPCQTIRIHLWRASVAGSQSSPVEITRHLLPLPSGSHRVMNKHGKLRNQPGPTGLLLLSPAAMKDFRFLTLSIAPPPAGSGGRSTIAAMAIAQFYRGTDAVIPISAMWLLSTLFKHREVEVEEGHALMLKMDLRVSPGLLPLRLRCNATQCGQAEGYKLDPQIDSSGESWSAHSCRVGCFPPTAILWDPHAEHEVIVPALRSELLVTDSPPAVWRKPSAWKQSTSQLIILLDPHCSYNLTIRASLEHATLRFFVSHAPQIAALAASALLFAIFQQTTAWELAQPLPSLLSSLAWTLGFPYPLLFECLGPLAIYLTTGILRGKTPDSFEAVVVEALVTFIIATAAVTILAVGILCILNIVLGASSLAKRSSWGLSRQVSQVSNLPQRRLGMGAASLFFTFFVHPCLGLLILLFLEASVTIASLQRFHSAQIGTMKEGAEIWAASQRDGGIKGSGSDVLRKSKNEFVEVDVLGSEHLDVFRHRHAILVLHFLACSFLLPSLVAWMRRPMFHFAIPSLVDSLPVSLILAHGFLSFNVETNSSPLPSTSASSFLSSKTSFGISAIYAVAGLASFLASLSMALSTVLYSIAAVGGSTLALYVLDIRREGGTRAGWLLKGRHEHHH